MYRQNAFLAQAAHETGEFQQNKEENGNIGSASKFYDLIDYIEEKGIENVKIVIEDEIN